MKASASSEDEVRINRRERGDRRAFSL